MFVYAFQFQDECFLYLEASDLEFCCWGTFVGFFQEAGTQSVGDFYDCTNHFFCQFVIVSICVYPWLTS